MSRHACVRWTVRGLYDYALWLESDRSEGPRFEREWRGNGTGAACRPILLLLREKWLAGVLSD